MIRHGLITELRIIGASEAASLILDMKAQLEKERAELAAARAEIDRLKRGKSCEGCGRIPSNFIDNSPPCSDRCYECSRFYYDNFKPRDPSAAQGVKNG